VRRGKFYAEKRGNQKNKMNMKERDIELLKFNYKNLHGSIWNNHKVSWVVTSIFIPILFGVQGYLIREYCVFSNIQVIMGVFVTELLLIIWLLIMWTFKHYNDLRKERLTEIEDIFNKEISEEISDFFKDKKGFNQYKQGYGKPKQIKSLKFLFKIKLSFMGVYRMIFWTSTSLNMILLGAKFLLA
jgi:hypothetical protein